MSSGGASVDVVKFDYLQQCEVVKNEFLNNMNMTHREITTGRFGKTVITRRAKCVEI